MQLRRGAHVALVACSNGLGPEEESEVGLLCEVLAGMGLKVVLSPHLYAGQTPFGGTPAERAGAVNGFYEDDSIAAIFDISGGDAANGVLPLLDYALIRRTAKPFFGYSDLTCVLNAMRTMAGAPAVLYQVRNLVRGAGEECRRRFAAGVLEGRDDLYDFPVEFLAGERMEGRVIGGNLRCLLKLAGTPYLPAHEGCVLFLEAHGGDAARIGSMLAQLRQMGFFEGLAGLLLGQFTELDKTRGGPTVEELALAAVQGTTLPVARTRQVGHSASSRALRLGEMRSFSK